MASHFNVAMLQEIAESLLSEDDAERDIALNRLETLVVEDESLTCALVETQLRRDQDTRRCMGYLLALDAIQSPQSQSVLLRHLIESEFPTPISADVIESVLIALKEEKASVRMAAATALRQAGDERAISGLVQTLRDDSWRVRASVADALGGIGDKRAVAPLVQVLGDEDESERVRLSAAGSLGRIGGERATAALVLALRDNNPRLQRRVADALVDIGDERVVASLMRILGDDEEMVNERMFAANALGRIGDERAVTELVRSLRDQHWTVQKSVADALAKIGDERAVVALMQVLVDEDERPNLRMFAASALGRIGGERAAAALMRTLNDKSSCVQRFGANILLQIGDEAADAALAQVLGDRRPRVGNSRVPGQVGNARAVARLVEALADDWQSVRASAADIRGQTDDVRTIAGHVRALRDQRWAVQKSGADALAQIGDERALVALMQILADENERASVRMLAAEALGTIGDERAIWALIQGFRGGSPSVQKAAVSVLVQIGGQHAVAALAEGLGDKRPGVREFAVDALGQLGNEPAVALVVQALTTDDSHRVRKSAADVLGRIGDEKAVIPLVEALTDDSRSVRASAAEALGRIGDEKAVAPLVGALTDDSRSVRTSAAEALGRIGDEEAVAPLVEALTDDSRSVRTSAADALGRIGDEHSVAALVELLRDEAEGPRLPIFAFAAEPSLGRRISDPGLRMMARSAGGRKTLTALYSERTSAEMSTRRVLYPNIRSPKYFVLGQPDRIEVQLATSQYGSYESVDIEFAPGETEASVGVRMLSDAFAVMPEWLSIRVGRSGNSSTASFSVLPERIGKASLSVEFFRRGQRVGLLVVRAFVAEETPEGVPFTAGVDSWLEQDVLSLENPGLHLYKPTYGQTFVARATPVSTPEQKVVWFNPAEESAEGQETQESIDWQKVEGAFENFRTDLAEYIEESQTFEEKLNLNVLEEREPDDQIKGDPRFKEYVETLQDMRFDLESLGIQLYEQMVAPSIGNAVRRLPEGTPIHFGTDADLSWVPWELVYDEEREAFWGELHPIGRLPVPLEDPQSDRAEYALRDETEQIINFAGRGLVIGGKYWKPVLERLYRIFSGRPASGNFRPPFDPPAEWTVRQFSQMAAKGDVIHITCIGERDNRGDYYLRLGPGVRNRLKGRHLYHLSLQPQSLIFTNACSTASGTFFLNEYCTFAWRLYLRGAGAYVGTVAPVPTIQAIRFAEAVYRQLIEERKPVGESLWLAKRQFARKEPAHPFYLFYSLYGDSRWRWPT